MHEIPNYNFFQLGNSWIFLTRKQIMKTMLNYLDILEYSQYHLVRHWNFLNHYDLLDVLALSVPYISVILGQHHC